MSFTNKTEHFDLPQYVASDKPTYLVDFNNAMQKIDSAMYGATQDAEQASTTATSASNKVDEMRETVANLEQTTTTQGNSITALQNSNSLLTQRITQEEVKGQQRDVKIQSLESSVASATSDAANALTESGTLKGQLTANQTPFIYDYQNGQYGYNTDPARGADTFHPFKSDVVAKKLWNNTSTSSFNGQTVNFDSGDYTYFIVKMKTRNDFSDTACAVLVAIGGSTGCGSFYSSGNSSLSRNITATKNNSITFGDGHVNDSTNNAYMIPTEIYGVKITI